MAPTKSALKLYDVCLARAHQLLVATGHSIVEKYGPYSNPHCKSVLHFTQGFLCAQVHPALLDDILKTFPPGQAIQIDVWLVILDLLMHINMRVFLPRFWVRIPNEQNFLKAKIKSMDKLVILNLALMCTDEILSVVGSHCPALERINIVSKEISVHPFDRRLFVSDSGLAYLHKCKKLRYIIMNRLILSFQSGRSVTHNGIKRLLRHLPDIRFIDYSDMGLVLENMTKGSPQLNLVELQDDHVVPSHIDIFDKYCPKLKKLSIAPPSDLKNPRTLSLVAKKLATSRLTLSSLQMKYLPFDENLTEYLKLKGHHLLSFVIICGSIISTDKFILLAEHCPNLRNLEVELIHQSDTPVPPLPVPHSYFKELRCLQLIGDYWDPYYILPLCLNNATHLVKLVTANSFSDSLDRFFLDLLCNNRLEELQLLSIHGIWNMSPEVFQSLLFTCKSLNEVMIPHNPELISIIKELRAKYVNFDLKFLTDRIIMNFLLG